MKNVRLSYLGFSLPRRLCPWSHPSSKAKAVIACCGWAMARSIESGALFVTLENEQGGFMATQKQRAAARKNIKKAARAAKRKQTLKHLPKKTRRALGQQAAKVRESRR